MGMSFHERGLGWDGTEGCTGMLLNQMNFDGDKDDWVEYIQEPRYRSCKHR